MNEGPVEGLTAVLLLPILGVNATSAVPSAIGTRVCADAVNDFLTSHPDDDVAVVVLADSSAAAAALRPLIADGRRCRVRSAADGPAFGGWARDGSDAPSFVAVEMTWRMVAVPNSSSHAVVSLIHTGSSALQSIAKDALRDSGADAAEVGRAYVVPISVRSHLTPAGRATAPRLRFVVAAVPPNMNRAKADPLDEADAVPLLRSCYDNALSLFLRTYNKHCE